MSFDLFVQSCIVLKRMTDVFKKYDDDRDGYITLSFEEFLAGGSPSPFFFFLSFRFRACALRARDGFLRDGERWLIDRFCRGPAAAMNVYGLYDTSMPRDVGSHTGWSWCGIRRKMG